MADWNAGEYDRFGEPRQRAAMDLLAGVGEAAMERITDLGCGSGLSTELLLQRWPEGAITALDKSPAMLSKARQRLPTVRFTEGDIATFSGGAAQNLIFANASLHWIPDHRTLIPRLAEQLAPGGTLAIQMPDNLREPSHELMEALAGEPAFAPYFQDSTGRRGELLSAAEYYNLLAPVCESVHIWLTRYFQVLDDAGAIADWFATTGLKPYVDRLPPSLGDTYRSRYVEELQKAYGAMDNGRVLLAMPRLFIIARRSRLP